MARQTWSEVVAHEMFHYYTHGPRWFSEGSAEFIQAYVNDRTGARALDDRRIEVLKEVQECIENGKENLRHLNYLEAAGGPLFGRCAYEMGENFLLAVFDLIGEEGMSSALRELYLSNREFSETSGSSGQYASEERIYSVFPEPYTARTTGGVPRLVPSTSWRTLRGPGSYSRG